MTPPFFNPLWTIFFGGKKHHGKITDIQSKVMMVFDSEEHVADDI